MAFNLNKNNKSTFDLSKKASTQSEPVTIQNSSVDTGKKGNKLIWAVLILALMSAGALYMATRSNTNSSSVADTNSSEAPSDSDAKVSSSNKINDEEKVKDTIASQQTPAKVNDKNVEPSNASSIGIINNSIPVQFAKGSSNFSTIDKMLVQQLVKLLKDNPKMKIEIEGYASSEGPETLNQQISQNRAEAFKVWLMKKGIKPSYIIATGKGIANPIASNETEDGRKRNRRVQVIIPE